MAEEYPSIGLTRVVYVFAFTSCEHFCRFLLINPRVLFALEVFSGLWVYKISNRTKIRLFKSNILSVLLYAAESWKVTKSICQMLEVFQNKCLRKILRIYWPNKISNTDLHERTGIQPISLEVKRCRWKWIGHICRMPLTSIPRVAMRRTPGGKRARRRPKETWRRSVEREMKALGWSWGQVTKLATDRQHWRSLVSALCVIPHEED